MRTLQLFMKYYQMFLGGLWVTLYMSAITVFFGTIFGTLLCLIRGSRFKPLQWLSTAYIEILRGTPLLLQMFIMYFVASDYFPSMTKMSAVLIALIANSAAYVAELIRAGIQAVDHGQTEAARSLGMSSALTMKEIILPQAVRNILPALGNEFISIIKESSIASTFFVGEIMTVRALITGALYLSLEPLYISGILYFTLTFSLSKLVGFFERRLAISD